MSGRDERLSLPEGRFRIISGGQTGSDRGGLRAAHTVGLPWGGWATLGWRAEDGQVPEEFRSPQPGGCGLREARDPTYSTRTRANVWAADLVVAVQAERELTPGTRQTIWEANRRVPPGWRGAARLGMVLVLRLEDTASGQALVRWLRRLPRGAWVMVAGPRESLRPGVELATQQVLERVLQAVLS